jgi:hypothetical protein
VNVTGTSNQAHLMYRECEGDFGTGTSHASTPIQHGEFDDLASQGLDLAGLSRTSEGEAAADHAFG